MSSPLHSATSIDNAIIYCARHGLHVADKNEQPFHHVYGHAALKVGPFYFDCHEHDTGNGVRIILVVEGRRLEIANLTYWHSSRYTFNNATWLEGAWSGALEEAMGLLRLSTAGHALGRLVLVHEEMRRRLESEAADLAFFEAPFKAGAPA